MDISKYKTIPNMLSLFRLFSVPILFVLAFLNLKWLFIILFTFSAITDKLDGMAARFLKQSSEFGARMDSLADEFFYDSTALWLFIFVPELFFENIIIWVLIIALSLVLIALTYSKFGVHTYLNQINAGLFLIFAFYTFVFGYNVLYFYIAAAFIFVAKIENLLIYIKYKGNIPFETKSLFH